MTTLIVTGSACYITGLLVGVALMAVLAGRAYRRGYRDAERAIAATDQTINLTNRANEAYLARRNAQLADQLTLLRLEVGTDWETP